MDSGKVRGCRQKCHTIATNGDIVDGKAMENVLLQYDSVRNRVYQDGYAQHRERRVKFLVSVTENLMAPGRAERKRSKKDERTSHYSTHVIDRTRLRGKSWWMGVFDLQLMASTIQLQSVILYCALPFRHHPRFPSTAYSTGQLGTSRCQSAAIRAYSGR